MPRCLSVIGCIPRDLRVALMPAWAAIMNRIMIIQIDNLQRITIITCALLLFTGGVSINKSDRRIRQSAILISATIKLHILIIYEIIIRTRDWFSDGWRPWMINTVGEAWPPNTLLLHTRAFIVIISLRHCLARLCKCPLIIWPCLLSNTPYVIVLVVHHFCCCLH